MSGVHFLSKPNFHRALFRFEENGTAMVEVWTVSRNPEQPADNTWINIAVVTRTAAEHERLEEIGAAAIAGNAVPPGEPANERISQFGATNQEQAIELLVQRHLGEPQIRQQAEALVYSL